MRFFLFFFSVIQTTHAKEGMNAFNGDIVRIKEGFCFVHIKTVPPRAGVNHKVT